MSNMTKCFSLILLNSIFIVSSAAGDILSANQSLKSGETIVSAGSVFELGFFSLGSSSKNQYLSIRYKHASATVVWVFNRDAPLAADGSGMFTLSSEGTLNLLNATNTTIWSSNSSTSLKNPVAQLLDSGNLVIRTENDSDSGNFYWQSFNFPDNTFLPGMKLGKNLATGLEWSLNSWESDDDPSHGNFQVKLDVSPYPQLFLWRGSVRYIRIGPWNGLTFSGIATAGVNNIFEDELDDKEEEIYYKYEPISDSMLVRLVVEPDGQVIRYTWTNQSNKWEQDTILQADYCDDYARCGAYGSCNVNSLCSCLDGFHPQNSEAWRSLNFSEGCVPKTQFNCSDRDDFVPQSNKKWPDTQNSSYISMNLEDCKKKCLENCSCTAYANTNITGKGSGCLFWFGGLIDIRDQEQRGQDFYVRVVASGSGSSNSSRARRTVLIVLVLIISILAVVLGFYLWHVCKNTKNKREGPVIEHAINNGSGDLPVFEFRAIADATNNFSYNNKLGEGGFGPVYKGTLEDGQEIAVKRRSTCSTQGIEEFKNEVSCIAKLQHRNLVRLLGWSTTEEGERILVYEYMPNKSLDFFIFGEIKHRASLDWPKRYKIINGIAKGILYLHEDSRLRVIHRDLKASNILLDYNMNPKISDFGMARSFGDGETESNTARVVGTYGYMAPEYAIEGAFSVKSDVYSFGVLLIEIVSGQKCRFFKHPSHNLNLMGHAWKSCKEDRLSELIDVSIPESSVQHEAFRVIQIGLLCVQQYPEDRPNMSSVLLMFLQPMYQDCCLIPESPFYLEGPGGLFEFVEQRLKENRHVVIVVAEGAGQEFVAQTMQSIDEKDASGNRLLLDVGQWLTQKFKDHFTKVRKMTINLKYIDPTYMIRAVPSNASDNIYCTLLAQSAVHGAMAGYTGFTVGPVNSRHAYIPISRVTETQNVVKLTDRSWARLLASTNQPSFVQHNVEQEKVDKDTTDAINDMKITSI